MRTDPTLNQSETTHNLATDLEAAAWIMASAKRPQLFSVETWEHKEEAYMTCEFINEVDYLFDFPEFLRIRREQPEVFWETVTKGMAKLTAYLNQLLKNQRNIPALDIETESRQQESPKELPALNTKTK